MSNDALPSHTDFEADEAVFGGLGLWLTGGLSLMAWTGLALLLTSA